MSVQEVATTSCERSDEGEKKFVKFEQLQQ